ncbi:MAG: PH domain-containing protein [Planctomycetota bacterium]|nr:MAG: PH domain-containing protein [Planctomycetota bacterium]REK27267.1 MAG: PH domain-containing protein [Planctomycetota bacterium]REK36712.1 MAG: PH domain-containing protein [Planctomycetota bacterium]
MSDANEQVLYEAHPAMFRNHPFLFVLNCILCLAIVGIIIFVVWYFRCRGTKLTITNEQTTLRTGLLSKFTNDVFHENVRNIIVRQTFFQRIMGVGYVGISSAGQGGIEIEVNGIPDPDRVKQIIDDCRDPRSGRDD